MRDEQDHQLLHHNTFGINAKCKRFVEFGSEAELCAVLPTIDIAHEPLLLLGGGSNLLLQGDFCGTVLHSAIKGREVVRQDAMSVWLRCGSGEVWDDVVAYAIMQGWHGAENLSLIPGEVGATAVQNIGAYGVEVKELIESVEAIDLSTGKKVVLGNADCQYAYRQSRFKQEWRNRYVITHVVYRLGKGAFHPRLDYGNIRAVLAERNIDTPTAAELREAIIDMRNDKLPDPRVQGNAGSFFMNPIVERTKYQELIARYPSMPHYAVDAEREKIPAGWLIDQCGWKGKSLGPAGVHDRQALVLVNRGGATGQDILRLCKAVCRDVYEKFGVEIHPEVNII